MTPSVCFSCRKGTFDRRHPGKYGICEKFGVVIAKTRECKFFEEKEGE